MKCAVCGDPLPTGKKASARYCQDDCRAEAARNRARAKQKKARHSAAESQDRKRAERPTGRTANRERGGADSEQTLAATTGLIKVRRPRPSNRRSDRSESRNSLAHPLRIDIREQLLRQAPQGATGYALVLPAAQEGAPPKLVPRRKKGQDRSPYRLSPFDSPLDIRLRDATWYRILWFGKDGEQIPPPPDSGIPSLYFFLGTPDRVAPREIPTRLEPLALTADATDSAKPKLLAVSELVSETQEAAVSLPADPVDSAPQSPPEQSSPEQSPPEQSPPEQTSPEQTSPEQSPPEQSSVQCLVSEPKDSHHFVLASKKPPQKRHPFWSAEGRCLLHVESLAQLLYEQRAALAKEQGQPAPPEPLTQLSGEERKNIRRMARHPAMVQLGRMLLEHIASVQSEGIGVLESLPLILEARSPSEQQLLREAQQHPDKREYMEYLSRRARTLLAGMSPPLEPKTALSTAERKRLTKLVFDLRSMSTMVKLSDGGVGA